MRIINKKDYDFSDILSRNNFDIFSSSKEPYPGEDIWDTLLFLHIKGVLKDTIICGSLGLYLNNRLKRAVKDIDLLTIKDWYGHGHPLTKYKTEEEHSSIFSVNNDIITCWKSSPLGIKIDFLHFQDKPLTDFKYETVLVKMDDIEFEMKIEEPEQAIKFKEYYIKAVGLPESIEKHKKDLIELNNG